MRVLLATDGSKDANTACEWLSGLPLPGETQMMVLSVAALPLPLADARTVKVLRDAALSDAHRIAEDAQKCLTSRFSETTIRVSEGDPREEIIRTAEEWQAHLLVVGARGLGAIRGLFLGSVSRAVVHHAPCPVLVVKGHPRPFRKALVGVDGSEHALRAVEFLASLALNSGVGVRLIHVLEPLRFPSSAPRFIRAQLEAALEELKEERRAKAEAALATAAAKLKGKVGSVEPSIVEGIPGDKIVASAEEDGADLVVVGARGLGGIYLLLGSVSERVLTTAHCPVLIVRPGKTPGKT
jgi:nucleotide-binding universal stress UspA family protein